MNHSPAPVGDEPAPIPVTVVSGFLGAGKTTLLNHVLTADHGRRIGVLVNDFGSIDVDAELIADVSEGMVSLANGCICCTIRIDLIQAVLAMADLPDPPEHIVIESSGVADPAGIVRSFLEPEIWGTVRLDGVITVVDASNTLELPDDELRLAETQVAGGDLIVLNKVDLVDAESRGRIREWIEGLRPAAQLFESEQCRLPMEVLLGTGRRVDSAELDGGLATHVRDVALGAQDPDAGHDGHDHHHDLVFDTWSYISDEPVDLALVQQILTHLPNTVFRVKGFVHALDEPERRIVLHLVGRRATISPTGTWGTDRPQTRLVFISRRDTVNYAAIEQALDRCRPVTGATAG